MFFDTHAHLDDDRFSEDREVVIERIQKEGISLVVNIGASIESSKESLALAEKYDFIYAAVGVHPSDTDKLTNADLETIKEMARHKKAVAIGEIGLDYYYEDPDRETQKIWFKKQLKLAKELGMPYIIHDRDAHGDVLDIIREVGYFNGLMHCYSGSAEMAKELIKLGFYISIAGQVTFKNAPKVREVVKAVPVDRLLIETDSPYLTPEPFRGKRNDPSKVRFTCEKIAEIKGLSLEETAKITLQNGKTFYRIR